MHQSLNERVSELYQLRQGIKDERRRTSQGNTQVQNTPAIPARTALSQVYLPNFTFPQKYSQYGLLHADKINQETDPRPLANGKCQLSQEFEFQMESRYDPFGLQYEGFSSMLEVTVLVHSAKGLIQGGVCLIDITKSFSGALALKKCSDKSAHVTVNCLSQRIQTESEVIRERNSQRKTVNVVSQFVSRGSSISKKRDVRMRSSQIIKGSFEGDTPSPISISKISIASSSKLQKFLRGQIEQLQRQNEILNSKIRESDRNEKQIFQALKESKIQYDRLNNRCGELQGLNELNEVLLDEKDKCLRNYEFQHSRLEEQLSIFTNQIKLLQSKLQLGTETRNGASDRQNEKIQMLQKQLQNSTKNHLSLLFKYQEAQKTSIQSLRQKDRAFQQQKSKFISEINKKDIAIKEMKDEMEKQKSKQALCNEEKAAQNKLVLDLNLLIDKQKAQIRELNFSLSKTMKQKVEFQEELKESKKQEGDRLYFKKKINEAQYQTQKMRMYNEKVVQTLNIAESKVEELLLKHEKIENQKKNLQTLADHLKTELNRKQTDLSSIKEERDELKAANRELLGSSRIQSKRKYQQSEQLGQEIVKISQKVQILTFQNERSQDQIAQLKQQLFSLNRTIRENSNQIAQLKRQKQRLQVQLKQKEHSNIELQNRTTEMHKEIIQLQISRDRQDIKIKELSSELEQVSNVLDLSQQKILQSNVARIEVCEQLEEALRLAVAEKKELQHKLDSANEAVHEARSSNEKNKSLVEMKNEQNQRLKEELLLLEEQIITLKDESHFIRQASLQLDSKIKERQQDSNVWQTKTKVIQEANQQLLTKVADLGKYTSTLQKQYEAFKFQAEQSLKSILKIVSSDSIQRQPQNLIMISPEILPSEAIRIRNEWIARSQQSYLNLKEEKQFLECELMKMGQQLVESQMQYEQTIQKQKKERYSMQHELMKEHRKLFQAIELLRTSQVELKVSNQQFFRQNRDYLHNISELQFQLDSLKETIKELQLKLEGQEKQVIEITQKYHQLLRSSQFQKGKGAEHSFLIQKERLIIDIQTMKRIGSKRQEELNLSNERNRHLEQKLLSTQIQNKKIAFDLSVQLHLTQEQQMKCSQLTRAKEQLEKDMREISHELEAKERKVSQKDIALYEHSSRSTEQESRLQVLAQQNSDLLSEIHSRQNQAIALQDQIRELQATLKEKEGDLETQRKSAQQQKYSLERDISIYKILLEQAKGVIQNLQRGKEQNEQSLSSKQSQLARMHEQVQVMKKEWFQEQSHNESLTKEFQILNTNYEHSKSQIYALEEQRYRLAEAIQTLTKALKKKQSDLKSLAQQSNKRLQRQRSELLRQLDQRKTGFIQIEKNYSDLKEEYLQAAFRQQQKQKDILALKQEIQRVKAQYEEQLSQIRENVYSLQQRSEELVAEHRNEAGQLMKQIQNLQQEFIDLNNHLVHREKEDDTKTRIIEELTFKLQQSTQNSSDIS